MKKPGTVKRHCIPRCAKARSPHTQWLVSFRPCTAEPLSAFARAAISAADSRLAAEPEDNARVSKLMDILRRGNDVSVTGAVPGSSRCIFC